MEIQVFQAELDGDPGVEWLAVADSSRYYVLTWLRIDTLPNGSYELMPLAADKYYFHIYNNDPILVEGVGDFNR